MPGPVSDSYDPEFSTGERASFVSDAVKAVSVKITKKLGKKLCDIVEVSQGKSGPQHRMMFTEKELRVIRFALNRAVETI